MEYKQKQASETSMKPSSVPRDQSNIISSDQLFTHFNLSSMCYGIGTEQPFPEFAPGSEVGSGCSYPTDCNQSNGDMSQENHLSSAANSTPLGCDPRAMLSNLSFLEQKIHQVQDIVRSIMNREGHISIQPNELAAQQQLVTADLTSIIIQLISTAGTLLPTINGTLLSTNPSVGQLGSILGSPTSLVGLNSKIERSEGIISEGTKGSKCEEQIEGMASDVTETPDPIPVEEHDGKDEDGAEVENLPPGSYEVLQLEKEEILAPHTHFCSICGKGFKRDANLRMHMRGHGDEYKTPAALAKPSKDQNSEPVLIKRYSCPFVGCKRNKEHKKFQPLKTILCVKNHYKRSHCDKSYICSRCNSKKFSVLADLKTHEKHCGRDKWICSCGTTFSRKDKLFGHVSLFQGHTPALPLEETKGSGALDQGQSSEAMTGMGNMGFNFGGSSGDDIDALDVKVPDNVFSPLNFDSYNFGGLNEFPRPAFEVSENSFSFLPSMSSNYVRRSGDNSNFN